MSLDVASLQETLAKKGKHVTTACSNCRRRKIKCDGAIPRCSNCVLYDQECIYHHGQDKRKIAPKERLQALTAYCQQLETLLIENGIGLPSPPPMHHQMSFENPVSSTIPYPKRSPSDLDGSLPKFEPEQDTITWHRTSAFFILATELTQRDQNPRQTRRLRKRILCRTNHLQTRSTFPITPAIPAPLATQRR